MAKEEEEKVEEAEVLIGEKTTKTTTRESDQPVTADTTTPDPQPEDDAADDKQIKLAADAPWSQRMWEVFTTFWPLGLVAFGGPPAHVAILRDRLVIRQNWLDEEQFRELFAIGQGLPGPTSTQLVVSAALARAGPLGGIMALFLWNLPGFVVLTICGVLLAEFIDPNNPPWYLAGLAPAAISLVFKAFYDFGLKLDKLGVILALVSCLVTILINNDRRIDPTVNQWVFPLMIFCGGIVTYIDFRRPNPWSSYGSPSKGWDCDTDETMKRIGIPLWVGGFLLFMWVFMLILVIIFRKVVDVENVHLEIFEVMYRVGSIIFGGGQVVLPMLQDEMVPAWMTKDQFLQGLGLAQSMPGPLFNFAAYLGAIYNGVPGAFIGYFGIFTPGTILIFAVVPFWARLRHIQGFRAILKGVDATAIGLVGAACVILWEAAIEDSADAIVFCMALTIHVVWNVDAPLVVLAGGVLGAILHPDALDLGQVAYCLKGNEFIENPDLPG